MTYIYNGPAEFKNDVSKGFAAAYPQYVQRVEGAVHATYSVNKVGTASGPTS
jgi:hypothetical protein